MKLVQTVSLLLAATTLGSALVVITPGTTAEAKSRTYLKSFPKSIRGTWYRYVHGHYITTKVSAKKFSDRQYDKHWQTDTIHLHYFNQNNKRPKITSKNEDWIFAFKSNGTTKWDFWNNVKTNRRAFGGYKVVKETYKGKQIKVLKDIVYDALPVVIDKCYTTKKLAKHFNPKGLTYYEMLDQK